MKVYVIIQESFQPSYDDRYFISHSSVWKIMADENKAKEFVDQENAKRRSDWDPEYTLEVHEVN